MDTNNRSASFKTSSQYLLPALVILFGMQFLRSLMPSLGWYLRDSVGIGSMQLLPYAFGTFFLGFLAAVLRRILGPQASLWLTAGGLAFLRVADQFIYNPGIDLWLNITGVGLFLNFLPIFIGHLRGLGEWSAQRWAYGVVLGLGFDIALRGVFDTIDLNTLTGWLPAMLTVLLAALLLVMLWREPQPGGSSYSGVRFLKALPLMSLGPYIVLQSLYFSSQGYLEEVAGLNPPLGFILVLVGYALSAGGIAFGLSRPHALHPLLALGISIYLGYTVYVANQSSTWIVLTFLLGQSLIGWGLAAVANLNATAETRGLGRTTLSVAGGFIIFLILVFGYYVAQDIALPFSRQVLPAAAAVLLGLFIFAASAQLRRSPSAPTRDLTGLYISAGLLVVPFLYALVAGAGPTPIPAKADSVKVMTYNVHSGFGATGLQDLEAIAGVIEASGADVVAMQETSRVRLMDGGADIPRWLSLHLGMPFVFRGTEEPHWGNTILSRYPIIESGWGDLPRAGKLIGRGYLWARIDVGMAEPLLVIVTHLHHLEPDSDARVEQVPVLLESWNGQGHTIILGDFNAEPGSPEMRLLADAGLLDAWGVAGEGPGYTFSSDEPVKRIDWLWHSPDLLPTHIKVIQTQASDHMPVIATFEYQP